jgi:hypothetical protein
MIKRPRRVKAKAAMLARSLDRITRSMDTVVVVLAETARKHL